MADNRGRDGGFRGANRNTDRKPRGDRPAYGEKKFGERRFGEKKPYGAHGDKPAFGDRTPGFGATTFRDIEATSCHAAAAYITGLPESKVTRLTFQDVHVTFAEDAEPFVPAMACGVEPMVRQGIIAQNVKVLDLQNVVIEGQDGEELQLQNVDKVIRA